MLNYIYNLFGWNEIAKPLCVAGDILCTMTEGANTLKDYLPDVIEPTVFAAIDFVDQNRIISLAATSVVALGSAALWRYNAMRNQYLAVASGYRNNCGLHCILNTWLALPEAQIRELIDRHPIFATIIQTFADYYELDNCDADMFLLLCKTFNQPYDREILLGQVFRQVLRLYIPEQDLNSVADDKYIHDDLLSYITQEMGASLTIHNTRQFQSVQKEVTYPSNTPATWHVDAYHVGNHYNFKYPSYRQSVDHNTRRTQYEDSLLLRAMVGVGSDDTPMQEFRIKERVQAVHHQLTHGVQKDGHQGKKMKIV